ncbi:MAG: anaerobic glycerol-3-phosphate dehydrogenase subunit GlpB [Smithellaceae bacterium]
MSVVEYDIVVIGAGVAGLTAGARLAQRGFRVALVTAGEPTACLSTGCIDLCANGKNPLTAARALPEEHPLHHVSDADIAEAFSNFQKVMEKREPAYTGTLQKNRTVLSALGTLKTTCLAPAGMAASPAGIDEAIHIITFAGLKDFYPNYILSRFKNASCSTYDAGATTTMGIASRLEKEEFLEAFIVWLEQLDIQENKIGMPAVLGMKNTASVISQIEFHLERPVFEIPTLPPSMPGRRLFNALKDHFRSQGGEIYWNWPVAGSEKSGNLIEAVFTRSEGKPNSLNARAFILATGSFVGGGLTASRLTIKESVFDLPVHMPSERKDWFEEDYFSPDHLIGKAGICVDAALRPREAAWENIFVCGGILAHAQILKNGCGHGLSLSTGHAAADACAEYLK